MRAGRAKADQQVAGALGVQCGQDGGAVHRAHRKPGQVVVAFAVHARHLGGLAAHQGRTGLAAAFGDAGHHAGGGVHVQLAGGVVVQEQQRLCALGQQVVDAHGHQVDADGVGQARLDGDLQLGADAIGGGDQQRIIVAGGLQVE